VNISQLKLIEIVMISTDGQAYVKLHRYLGQRARRRMELMYIRRGAVQVKKSAADDLRVCSEKSPNIVFERDAANWSAVNGKEKPRLCGIDACLATFLGA
jgi:hypothetical protein